MGDVWLVGEFAVVAERDEDDIDSLGCHEARGDSALAFLCASKGAALLETLSLKAPKGEE